MKKCVSCEKEIHPKRLEILPNATQCVACSTTDKKAGITLVMGEGDHTYNDILIVDREDYVKHQTLEHNIYGKRKDDIIHPEDEENIEEGDDEETNELEGIEEIKDINPEDLED